MFHPKTVNHFFFFFFFQNRVQIKHIMVVKRNLFFYYCDVKEISFYYFQNTKLCVKHKKNTCEFYLFCWDHNCKLNEWCLIDCFHFKFRVSTQIMVHNLLYRKMQKVFHLQQAFNDALGHFF